MIRNLTLANLGKFINRSFDLANVTVFFGKNEAGKSTVFHALFGKLCSGGGSGKNEIRNRYGVDIDKAVSLAVDGDDPKIPLSSLENLFAIRTNDLSIRFDDSRIWIDRVRANLFTSGIDPLKLAGDLEQKYGEKSTLVFNKTMKRLEDDRKEAVSELDKLVRSRNDILSQERRAAERDADLRKVTDNNAHLLHGIEELDGALHQQQLIQDLKSWRDIQSALDQRRSQKEALDKLAPFESDHSQEAKDLQEHIVSIKEEAAKLRGQLETKSGDRQVCASMLDKLKSESIEKSHLAQKAKDFIREMDHSRPIPRIRPVTRWKLPLLFGGTVAILVGAVCAIMFPVLEWRIASAVLGALLGGSLIALSRRRTEVEELPDLAPWCEAIKDRWMVETRSARLSSNTPDALRQEIQNFVNEHDLMQAQMRDLEERKIGVSREIDQLDDGIGKQDEERRVVENQLADWLRRFNVPDPEAYRALRDEYQDTCHSIQEATRDIQDKCDRVGLGTVENPGSLVAEKIYELTRNIKDEELAAKDRAAMSDKLRELRKSQKDLVERMGTLQKEVGQEQGKALAALGRIPDEMAAAQLRIGGLDAEIGRLMLEKAAAATVAEIWREIAADSEMMFSSLSQEVGERFRDITRYHGGAEEPLATISALSAEGIKVQDAGGANRAIVHLSSATRDAFYLAARLTLALRMKEENKAGIFLLDDPFLTLDTERTLNAIKLLKAFQEQSGWQIVFFTKDLHTVDELRGTFPDLQLHNLDLAGDTRHL